MIWLKLVRLGRWVWAEKTLILTAKRMRDRSSNSSIKPKFEDQLFVDLPVIVQLVNLKLFCQFCKSKQKPFHVYNLYKKRKSTKNHFQILALNWRNHGSVLCSLAVQFWFKASTVCNLLKLIIHIGLKKNSQIHILHNVSWQDLKFPIFFHQVSNSSYGLRISSWSCAP